MVGKFGETIKTKLLILIFTIIFLILMISLGIKSSSKKTVLGDSYLKSLELVGFKFEEPFFIGKHKYNITVNQDSVDIICDYEGTVIGCNETISLENKNEVIHEIKVGAGEQQQIYKVIIKKRLTNKEKEFRINSIKINPLTWTNEYVNIEVGAVSSNGIESFSFDSGKTWQKSSQIKVDENKIISVIAKDKLGNKTKKKEIKIDKIDKEKPSIVVTKHSVTSDGIILKVSSVDNLSGVYGISFNDSEYEKTYLYTINKAGTYYFTSKDNAGNITQKVNIDISDDEFLKTDDPKEKIFTASFYNNFLDNKLINSISCTAKKDNCTIIVPEITRNDWEILGWSTNKSATSAQYKVGTMITLNDNTTYYAITKKTIKASFDKNEATSIGTPLNECVVYNDNSSCTIQMPTITMSGGKVLGWSTNKSATTAQYKVGATVTLSDNITYYAITKKSATTKTFTATFDKNGATSIGSTSLSCTTQGSSCTITLPSISRSGGTALGWSTDSSSIIEQYKAGAQVALSSNATYYAITKKTITISYDTSTTDTGSIAPDSCQLYNEEDRCQFKMPQFNKLGHFNYLWSPNPNATNNLYDTAITSYLVNRVYTFSDSVKLYPNYNHLRNTRLDAGNIQTNVYKFRNFSISKTEKIGNTLFEFQNGIPIQAINTFVTEVKKAYSKMPWLFRNGKVFVMDSSTYSNYSKAYALNHNSNSTYFTIDLQYDTRSNSSMKNTIDVNAILHELGHSWDHYYEYKNGNSISSQSDFINFYNSFGDYRDQTSMSEAFAAMTTNYYWHVLGVNTNKIKYGLTMTRSFTASEMATLKGLVEKYKL